MTVLLDTNVLSELLRPSPNPAVEGWGAGRQAADLHFSAVGEAELRYGVEVLPAGRRRDALALAIEAILREDFENRVLPFDSAAAREYADIAASRRAAGRPVAPVDCQIAAIARSRDLTIATRNVRHFADMEIELVDPWAGARALWLREGLGLLQATDRFLTATMIARDPRLALVRCAVLALTGRVAEARRLYEATGPLDLVADARGNDLDLRADHTQVRGLLAIYGCERIGSERARAPFADARIAVDTPGLERIVRGTFEYGLCLAHSLKAEFEMAQWRAERARACLGQSSSYVSMHVDFQAGSIAMAQGRVEDATRWFAHGRRVAKTNFLRDPSVIAHADVLAKELDLERHHITQPGAALQMAKTLGGFSTPYYAYVIAASLVAELSLHIGGSDGTLEAIDEIREHAYREELPALARFLAALRVGTLARAGDIGEAERTWQLDDLPEDHDGCIDLDNQTWQEMEALSCARLRLLAAREEFDEARQLATAITTVAAQRGLRRTWMRVMAQLLGLEYQAGELQAATGCLEQFLGVFRETDYLRPLVREGEASVAVLAGYLDQHPEPAHQPLAESLLATLGRGDGRVDGPPELTGRESEVLVRLEEQRDKQIAEALDLTLSGVRYHITNILAKLGARGRMDAVHRARRLGLLP